MDVDDYGPLLTAEAFIKIDFGERIKAELENGVIAVLNRGPVWRVAVAGNLLGSSARRCGEADCAPSAHRSRFVPA